MEARVSHRQQAGTGLGMHGGFVLFDLQRQVDAAGRRRLRNDVQPAANCTVITDCKIAAGASSWAVPPA
ncbi:hypothetical protein [Candidatus Amarolinea dominans]|uniref:hypothetical protein n=1 Tax=Candidatus Amarolinea dominans TaxID=3140696 RepID=UPI001DB2244C|nr:hypothetical protein [Anaerolineae bacterium]